MLQRTVKDTVSAEGAGLQTGKPVKITIKSAPAGSGINFIRTDLKNKPLLNLKSLDMGGGGILDFVRRTIIGTGPLQIQTTEHLLAALSGCGIDNVTVELDNEELPGMDGSAKDFVLLVRRAGVIEQDAPKKYFTIDSPLKCEHNGAMLEALPSAEFRITYALDYADPSIGRQSFDVVIDERSFEREIAPARTFCLAAEAEKLIKLGLGKGANYNNTLVMGKDGPINNALRFPDEPVRHKVLDLIGDLYLLGMPMKGHIVAAKSGHMLNMELVKELKKIAK